MEFTPVKTEEEKPKGKLGHAGSYLFLGAVAVASWFVLPVAAAFVQAAPILAAVVGIGGAAAITAQKPWREKAVSFFKSVGGMFSEAFATLHDDYRSARGWADKRAAEAKAAVSAPANDDGPSTLGAKASGADFNAAADATPKVKVKAPAPKPATAPVQKLG